MAISASDINAATAAMRRVRSEWLLRNGVTGMDVGLRRRAGRLTEELALRVYVKRKLPADAVPIGELFPGHLEEFAVDVIEGDFQAQS